jgi:hypothetical protein
VELQATDPSEMSMDIVKSRALWNSPATACCRGASAPACPSIPSVLDPFSCPCFPGSKSLAFCMRLYAIFPLFSSISAVVLLLL